MVAAASPPFSAATELERSPSQRAAGSVRGSHSILQVGGRGQNGKASNPKAGSQDSWFPPVGVAVQGIPGSQEVLEEGLSKVPSSSAW